MLQKQTQVAYTIWVRFMAVLVQSSQLSAVWARPVRLPFFEDNEPYLKSFEGFNLASKLKNGEDHCREEQQLQRSQSGAHQLRQVLQVLCQSMDGGCEQHAGTLAGHTYMMAMMMRAYRLTNKQNTRLTFANMDLQWSRDAACSSGPG